MAQILSDGRKLGVNGIAHLHKVLLSNDKRLKNSYGIGKEEIIKKMKEDRHQNLSNLGLNSNDGQLIIIGFCYSISLIYSKKKRNVIFLQFGLGANSCLLISTKTARITTKTWVFYHLSFQVGTFSDAGVVDNFKRRASFIPDVLFKHSLVLTINNFSLFLYCSLLVLLHLVKTEEPPFRITSTTLSTVSLNKAS